MVPFKIGNVAFELPASYGELTFRQFYALQKSDGNNLNEFAILSGLEKSFLEQCEDLELDYRVAQCLSFFQDKFDCNEYLVPDYITISGKRYKTPGGIGINTFGQKLALVQAITEAEKAGGNEIDCYPFVIALYMQPVVTGQKYNADLVEKLIPEVMECKLAEAWPLAGFFLSNYARYLRESAKNYPTPQPRKSLGPESIAFKSSETGQSYSHSRSFLIGTLRKLYSLITTRFSLPSLVIRKGQDLAEG